MTDTAEKLAPFAAMLDDLDDAALAAAAGVTAEEAAAFRAGGAPKPADEKPRKGSKAKPTTEAHGEPQEAPVVEEPPASVRVTLKRQATVTDTRGARPMPWRLSPRDIYSGEQAAYLWEHHREIVEAFPTKG